MTPPQFEEFQRSIAEDTFSQGEFYSVVGFSESSDHAHMPNFRANRVGRKCDVDIDLIVKSLKTLKRVDDDYSTVDVRTLITLQSESGRAWDVKLTHKYPEGFVYGIINGKSIAFDGAIDGLLSKYSMNHCISNPSNR